MKRNLSRLLCAVFLGLLLAGCVGNSTLPVYRIGLIAPFEGRYRELGYDVIYPARLALQEALASDSMRGDRVELVAYDDSGDPEQAIVQARALASDPTVLAVIGHWQAATTRAALPVYQAAGMPVVTLDGDSVDNEITSHFFVLGAPLAARQIALDTYLEANAQQVTLHVAAENITEAAVQVLATDTSIQVGDSTWGMVQFRELTRGVEGERWFVTSAAWPADLGDGPVFRESILASGPYAPEPGPLAPVAYDAARLTLDAIARAQTGGPITRNSVGIALRETDFEGITGPISFDENGFRHDAPLYLYRWGDESIPTLLARLR